MRVAIGTCVAWSVLGLVSRRDRADADISTGNRAGAGARPEISRIGRADRRGAGPAARRRASLSREPDRRSRRRPTDGRWAGRSFDYSAAVEAGASNRRGGAAPESRVRRRSRRCQSASADEVARLLVRDVAIAYARAAGADERVRLLADVEAVAAQLSAATDRRYQAGDVAALDVNLTRVAAARRVPSACAPKRSAAMPADRCARRLQPRGGRAVSLERGLDRAAGVACACSLRARARAGRRADADVAAARPRRPSAPRCAGQVWRDA